MQQDAVVASIYGILATENDEYPNGVPELQWLPIHTKRYPGKVVQIKGLMTSKRV